jgi:hypothetical protein
MIKSFNMKAFSAGIYIASMTECCWRFFLVFGINAIAVMIHLNLERQHKNLTLFYFVDNYVD